MCVHAGHIRYEYRSRVFDGMDHSDTFKPQGIAAQRNITYGIPFCDRTTWALRTFYLLMRGPDSQQLV